MKDVRIRFRKLGLCKYISHLDLTRTMTRAVRRAGIPIWYTEGFNRHPYLTFAAPLSLGFEGMEESMDLRLTEEMPMDELAGRLNAVMPKGLEVYAASEPVMKAGEIAFAEYRLTFTGHTDDLSAFLAQETVSAEKRSKKGTVKLIDLKPWLDKAACTNEDGGRVVMDIVLPCSSVETINPSLIAGAYQAYAEKQAGEKRSVFCDVLRLRLLNRDGKDFA